MKLVVLKNGNEFKLNIKVIMKEKIIEVLVKKGMEVGKMEVFLKDGDKLGYVDGK